MDHIHNHNNYETDANGHNHNQHNHGAPYHHRNHHNQHYNYNTQTHANTNTNRYGTYHPHTHADSNQHQYQYPYLLPTILGTMTHWTFPFLSAAIVLLLTNPTIRSSLYKTLSLPLSAIRILSTTFVEQDDDEDDMGLSDIRDDDDDDDEDNEEDIDAAGHDRIMILWKFIMSRFHNLTQFLTSTAGIRWAGGRMIVGDYDYDADLANGGNGGAPGKGGFLRRSRGLQNIALPLRDEYLVHFMPSNTEAKDEVVAAIPQSPSKKKSSISFGDANIEPTFLKEEDYPDDWMEYDPIRGKLVRRKDRLKNMNVNGNVDVNVNVNVNADVNVNVQKDKEVILDANEDANVKKEHDAVQASSSNTRNEKVSIPQEDTGITTNMNTNPPVPVAAQM